MKYLVLARRLLLPLSWGKIPSPSDSFDLGEPGIPKRVQRGGSFLSTAQYCSPTESARGRGASGTDINHVGFRCVYSAKPSAPLVGANTNSQ